MIKHARNHLTSRVRFSIRQGAPALLNAHHDRGLAPQSLEVVVAALFWQESMHDDVAVIHEDPAVLRFTFCTPGKNAVAIFELLPDMLNDCFELPIAVAAENYEKIRDGRNLPHVHQDDAFTLPVRSYVHDCASEIDRFQFSASLAGYSLPLF